MSCNWAGNLDMLAQNGVIDFDAASYIMGQPLRYVGNPAHPNPFNGQPPTMTNLQQPNIDEFKPQTDKDKSPKLPMWKKLDSVIDSYLESVTIEDLINGKVE